MVMGQLPSDLLLPALPWNVTIRPPITHLNTSTAVLVVYNSQAIECLIHYSLKKNKVRLFQKTFSKETSCIMDPFPTKR